VGTLGLLYGDRDVAEELTQETMARIWVNWPKIRDLSDQRAAAWAYRVALNLARSWLRRKAAERRALARLATSANEQDTNQFTAEAITIRRAVATLPRRQRVVLVLRYYADLPVIDVAHLMGCAPGTVKSLTSQAVSALRQHVSNDQEGGLP
jgi:RNA polymerase sigma factor (sigma-70 family)